MKLPSLSAVSPATLYLVAGLVISNLVVLALWQSASHKVEVLQLAAKAGKAETERTIKEQEQITEDTTNGWKAALDVTRADWSRRLQRARVSGMPAVPATPRRIDEVPTDALPLAGECAETTLLLIYLQDWAAKQKQKGTPTPWP